MIIYACAGNSLACQRVANAVILVGAQCEYTQESALDRECGRFAKVSSILEQGWHEIQGK